MAKNREEVLKGTTTKIKTEWGNLYITANIDEDNKPYEVFIQMGKAGGCASSQLQTISRLISLSLKSGINIKDITKQLKGIRCPCNTVSNGKEILSCADVVAQVLSKFVTKSI